MGDFIGILVLIIYLVAVSSSKSKKAQKKQARIDKRRAEREHERKVEAARAQASMRKAGKEAHSEQECAQQRVYLHEATQEQMHLAAEGEDPCYAGGVSHGGVQAEPAYDFGEPEQENQLAQDVLRGVIMSEILTRPCDRMAARQHRRRA